MIPFIVRRLLISIPVLIIASMLTFLMVAASGSPLEALRSNPKTEQSTLDMKTKELNLDKSIPQRYVLWAGNAVKGDFGKANNREEVRPLLLRRAQVTIRMVVVAMILALILAVLAGVFSAVRQYSVGDYSLTFLGFVLLSMPTFWFAAVLKEWLAIKLNKAAGKTLVYTIGDRTPNYRGGFFGRMGDYAGHLILPTIALALLSYASWSRFQRASTLEVLNSDYVRLARAKGLRNRVVLRRHALRTALIPLTSVVAVDIGAILGGAVVTESVFQWKGLGDLLIGSLSGPNAPDVNVALAWLMFSAVIVILFNLIADILYAFLDPRIRYA